MLVDLPGDLHVHRAPPTRLLRQSGQHSVRGRSLLMPPPSPQIPVVTGHRHNHSEAPRVLPSHGPPLRPHHTPFSQGHVTCSPSLLSGMGRTPQGPSAGECGQRWPGLLPRVGLKSEKRETGHDASAGPQAPCPPCLVALHMATQGQPSFPPHPQPKGFCQSGKKGLSKLPCPGQDLGWGPR